MLRYLAAFLRPSHPVRSRPRGRRPALEALEDRTLPSTLLVTNLNDSSNATSGDGSLRGEVAAAHSGDTIQFAPGLTGGTIILGGSELLLTRSLSILGPTTGAAGITIDGNHTSRIFEVQGGASHVSVTLQHLTLQNGYAFGSGSAAQGGAIYNQGALTLNGVTVLNNNAQGSDGISGAGQSALGGGIYTSGVLTLEGGTTIQANHALGGAGAPHLGVYSGAGGGGMGGGVYVAGGTATLTNVTLSWNTAQGGQGGAGSPEPIYGGRTFGGAGGSGQGGALDVAGGTVTLTSATLSNNSASGGAGGLAGAGSAASDGHSGAGLGGALYAGSGTVQLSSVSVQQNTAQGGSVTTGTGANTGLGEGGGLYIDSLAAVSLDTFTRNNVKNNTASTKGSNIYGQYTLI
jgi:hypothetical protein